MSAQLNPKWRPGAPVHLEPIDGKARGTYPLILAAYNDQVDDARAILRADPGQINLQEPFAGLTALHIAVFRQNEEMVELLVGVRACDLHIKDNFHRSATDMLLYIASPLMFGIVLRPDYSDEEKM